MLARLRVRAVALTLAVCVSGCMLPPPGHRVAFVIDGAMIAGGVALAATAEEPSPDGGGHLYRQERVGGLLVTAGVIGVLGTFLISAISARPKTKPSAKQARRAASRPL